MPGTTSPDGLVYPVIGDTAGPRVAITQLADSVQDALNDIHVGADRVVNFYGTAGNIGLVTPKDGDTYQESDGNKILWKRTGGLWVTNEGGLFLIRPTSVTGAATIRTDGGVETSGAVGPFKINGIFGSRFRNYKIVMDLDIATGATLRMRWTVGGVEESTTAYYTNGYETSSAAIVGVNENPLTYINLTGGTGAAKRVDATVYTPQIATKSTGLVWGSYSTGGSVNARHAGCGYDVNKAVDGLSIFNSVGADFIAGGQIRIYGLT